MADKQLSVTGLQLWQWRNVAIQAANATAILPTEVDWLLQEVAGLDRLALRLESYKNQAEIPLKLSLEDLDKLWQQRLNEHLPVQYVAGATPWRKYKIAVSKAVLIPRPETEYLIDLAVAAARNSKVTPSLEQGHWADLGTGSGAIAIGLADVFTTAIIHAVDYSHEALVVAKANAQNLGFGERIQFYQGSWWQPLASLKGQFSGMISNPPYIPTNIIPTLQLEVVKHEPHLALDGGIDGLDCIRHLVEISSTYLRSGGVWLIEMMKGQADAVGEMLHNQGSYCNIQIHKDLAGIERFALAYRKS
ncbi:peptide chain release factor N(5)-glutamine methyltransferase [Brasilonema octagenarum UFV-E1]|uniref:Release factor glutamine methyltransferase n=2 Tax=Brasilonema TaxID=383614 RepID=A0A856MFG0_9CYAN|nr:MULTISPECIES: peptide chain release factor N(5)-glutamine methyltransferase [Brasilonema]NMF64118.1 peptide chain release factor N(5)-glutamine methyltransferase [Brasilonema octagenarum UFV-OR1]QDL07807.1 peptide chain release factor N(5)-glutamine methyltransferase [Brasilonema sennae CENA114]QDL14168.1 peptide chain release factor N(5)-glutamine methyltransferase [Brasilonema octagenarum UFV-E1]